MHRLQHNKTYQRDVQWHLSAGPGPWQTPNPSQHVWQGRSTDAGGGKHKKSRWVKIKFLVPAALEGRTLSLSDSLTRIIFGSWTHGLFHSSLLSFLPNLNLLHFVLSMTNLPGSFNGVGPGKQQIGERRCLSGLELWSHPLAKRCEKTDLLVSCNLYPRP